MYLEYIPVVSFSRCLAKNPTAVSIKTQYIGLDVDATSHSMV